jgi:hypothetical protein
MNKIFFTAMLLFSMCSASSQNNPFKKYLDSFKESSKEQLSHFRSLLNNGKNMTKEQAAEFVYQNDTSRLYCHFQEFNMETEERGAFTRELYLPQKCLKLTTTNFILIGYSSFECSDPQKLSKVLLTIKLINSKSLNVTDSLVVYSGNEYDWEITGLINPQNYKIFTVKEMGKRTSIANAIIYRVNDALQFEIAKQQDNIENMSDDLEKDIELLGWKEAFLN